ncbi:MAG: hypothetical protein R3B69_04070 [Candidatus Paceibacterota bacterium]
MYKRARAAERKGALVRDVPVRTMRVFEAECNATMYDSAKKQQVVNVRFNVGSGTYIRSLAEEFGKRLGYPATLKNLRRTKVGEFKIENAQLLQ